MPRLLVVDDDALIVEALELVMSDQAHVFATVDPREALASIEAGDRFDVLLLDIMMPEMSGIDLFERIGMLDAGQAERVVFMTAGAPPSLRERLARLPNQCLDKPLELPELEALLWSSVGAGAPTKHANAGPHGDSARMRSA